jgi:hypothetical protein
MGDNQNESTDDGYDTPTGEPNEHEVCEDVHIDSLTQKYTALDEEMDHFIQDLTGLQLALLQDLDADFKHQQAENDKLQKTLEEQTGQLEETLKEQETAHAGQLEAALKKQETAHAGQLEAALKEQKAVHKEQLEAAVKEKEMECTASMKAKLIRIEEFRARFKEKLRAKTKEIERLSRQDIEAKEERRLFFQNARLEYRRKQGRASVQPRRQKRQGTHATSLP